MAGNSRIWGDASTATQTAAIDAIIQAAAAHNLNTSDTALLLSIVKHESGFNPDAAAGTTSASGLGQFTNSTGAEYGITAANRWNVTAQAKAAVSYFIASKNAAIKAGLDSGHIYAFWHDGINSGGTGVGARISTEEVMPNVGVFQTYLKSKDFGLTAQHSTIIQRASDLAGKSPAERARHTISQARAGAAKKPLSTHARLHVMLMKLSPKLPHMAPPPQGQRRGALPPRHNAGGVAGLPGAWAWRGRRAGNAKRGVLAPAPPSGPVGARRHSRPRRAVARRLACPALVAMLSPQSETLWPGAPLDPRGQAAREWRMRWLFRRCLSRRWKTTCSHSRAWRRMGVRRSTRISRRFGRG
ncbi:MAG: transglycosylase SLT domain-containing protein [Rhodospirillales bacterium]|nr:transglycosylase SLT domain-containing protein [Rhodospirillales bacterium]